MNQQTILKNLEKASMLIDVVCNTGHTLQDSDVRILESIFSIIKKELNITHCPDCKYCVKTKDGEYNPDDIVCSYWNSDGLESGDFCSYGEKGEYEWCDGEIHEICGRWITKNDKKYPLECSECGYEVPKDGYFSRYCPMCGVKMVNFKELEEEKNDGIT